jgi:4a-hydroxytetrahydrobiopterin dehydratase
MERKILDAAALESVLGGLSGWSGENGWLKKRWTFDNFAGALTFVNRVGELAEAADHHPDITFGWGYAEIALTTHDRGGITDVDVALASKIEQLT